MATAFDVVLLELALRASLSMDPPYADRQLTDMSFVRIPSVMALGGA